MWELFSSNTWAQERNMDSIQQGTRGQPEPTPMKKVQCERSKCGQGLQE